MIDKAILLVGSGAAAGTDGIDPLSPIAGAPLLQRALAALEQQGIQEVIVIAAGDRGAELRLRALINEDPDPALRLVWLRGGPDALLRARAYLDGPALVVDGQLLFGSDAIAPLFELEDPPRCAILVDRDLPRVYDASRLLDVRTEGRRVVALGPTLDERDAVFVGAAVITPEAVDELAEEALNGTPALQQLLTAAMDSGQLVARNVDGARWQQVDSHDTLRHADWMVRAYGDELRDERRPQVARPLARGGEVARRMLAYIEGLLSEKRPRHNVLMNPGPVLTSPRVKSALVHHDVCHRDEDYAALVQRVQRKLRRICRGGPEHQVILLSGSGTAAIEATVSSCVPAEGKLLVISNGAFGERFAEIAELHGIETVHLRYDWGELVDPSDVERELAADDRIVAVSMCHHETSIGLLNPVRAVGALCRRFDRMFFVDAVSSLGGEEIDVRKDHVDILISSANKCLHAISGVSFVCVDPRVWPRVEAIAPRVYYLDLKHYRKKQIPYTPAVSNFFALDAALDELLREGVAGRIRHYRSLNRRIRRELAALGLRPLTDTGHESHTITTVAVPDYASYNEIYDALKRRGYVVYGCKDHLKDRYFQIANMGELSDEMVDGFLEALGAVLKQCRRQAEQLHPRLVAVGG